MKPLTLTCLSLLMSLAACKSNEPTDTSKTTLPTEAPIQSQTDAPDGISVPPGFQVMLFAEKTGRARHLAVRDNGDLYVRLNSPEQGHCAVALRDENGSGQADRIEYFDGPADCGTGMEIAGDQLYFSSDTAVFRAPLQGDELLPGPRETLVENLGTLPSHQARSLALDGQGGLYVNVGAPSNACQQADREPGSPGQDPCPLLEAYGGIFRFDANKPQQDKLRDGHKYVTGLRHAVALSWNPDDQQLYLVQHGRDQLNTLFPEHYTDEQNANLPAESFFRVKDGDNLGWPYCYDDPLQNLKVLSPEYGGDGKTIGRCAQYTQPLIGFPAHYAPNDLLFYTGSQFPEAYQNGAFIAFHGSWNRAPLEQEGYNVVFVPFEAGQAGTEWSVFASGFAGSGPITNANQATYRPMGLAQGPDGSLFVADSKQGRIWRISYLGN